jgi:hypothetical protein
MSGGLDSGFILSDAAWDALAEGARGDEVDSSLSRNGAGWLDPPTGDLRETLRLCTEEMDAALAILLKTACHTLRGHVGCLLEA